MPGRTDRDVGRADDVDLLAALLYGPGDVLGRQRRVGDVLRVDRRQQAQDHDQDEQAAEEQRDLVSPQAPPGKFPRPDAGRKLFFAGAAEPGEIVREFETGAEAFS